MRRALLVSLGVAATFVAAVFVGAAAANVGAPVFYDARYPQPASPAPDGYDVSAGGGAGSPDVPSGEPDADGAPTPAPGATPHPTPPASQPPAAASPTPSPSPTPTPSPEPGAPGAGQRAPGGPPSTPDPGAAPPSAEEREAWLRFQQVVRSCMADAGHEYRYWEWWNPGPDTSNRFPAMPEDLTSEEAAAWELALHGETPGGEKYRWKDAGCWGYALHVTGGSD